MNSRDSCTMHLRIFPEEQFSDTDILTYKPNLPIEPVPYDEDVNMHYLIDGNTDNTASDAKHAEVFCWWDCKPFEGNIFRIPIKTNDCTIQTVGYFCSPACAAAYNLNCGDKFGSNKWNHMELLQKLYGKTCVAPPRECLSHFGGSWSLSQFRKNKEPVRTLYPPIYFIKPNYEKCFDYEKTQSYVPIDPSKVAIAEKQLKLSRSETKQNRENMSLDMFISINKK